MGGSGSGRTGGYPTSEACASYVLNVQWLNKAKLRDGAYGTTSVTFSDGFSVSMKVDMTNPANRFVELVHERNTGGGEEERYRVYLYRTRPPFGGVRWWFCCPYTHQTVAKLFLPRGGHRFWSRGAYRLGYACQREAPRDRMWRRARKIRRELGGGDNLMDDYPDKPKWMRWRTYDRKLDLLDSLETRADHLWGLGAMRLLARLGKWP
jgi:hypothetical protein